MGKLKFRTLMLITSKWNKCRIYVGDQLDRWNELKDVTVLRVQTRALNLQIFCLIGKPNMFFPDIKKLIIVTGSYLIIH
jgi:hypothetical protein